MSSLLTDGQIYTALVPSASLCGYSSLFTKHFIYESFQNGYQKSVRMLTNWSGSHGDTRDSSDLKFQKSENLLFS